MTKWQYRFAALTYWPGEGFVVLDGIKREDGTGFLNTLGDAGWEVTSASSYLADGETLQLVVLLKRPNSA